MLAPIGGYLLWWPTAAAEQSALVVNLLYLVLFPLLIALAVLVATDRGIDGQTRRAWGIFAIAYGCYWVGSIFWYASNYFWFLDAAGTWIDLIFLCFYPLLLWGVLRLPLPRPSDLLTFSIDAAIAALGGSMLIWQLLIRPLGFPFERDLPVLLLSLSYAYANLMLIFATVVLLLRHQFARITAPLLSLMLAIVLQAAGDILYGVQLNAGNYSDGGIPDSLWLLSLAGFTMGAWLQLRRRNHPLAAEQPSPRPMPLLNLLPYLGIAAGYGLVLWNELPNLVNPDFSEVLLYSGAVVLTLLVLARQFVAARQNDQLRARREAEEALARQLASEQCFSAISNEFINLPLDAPLDAPIDAALARLGAFTGVDRCYLLVLQPDGETWTNTHEWCAAGIAPQIAQLQAVPSGAVPWWTEQIMASALINVPRVEALPPEASVERAMLLLQSIRSVLVMPLAVGGRPIGALGFDAVRAERSWGDDAIRPLALVGSLLARVLTHHQTALALRTSDATFRLIAEHVTDLITCHGLDGSILYCSPASFKLLGYSPGQVTGGHVWDYIHPDDVPVVTNAYHSLLATGEERSITYRLRRSDGQYLWFESSGRVIFDGEGAAREVVSVSRDITLRRAREDEVARLAFFDPLTGLANRRQFHERVEHALAARSADAAPLAVLFLDLDRFKLVNDTLGHDAGDELLAQVAERLREATRDEDTLARLGGDEFALLAPGADVDAAARLAERLLKQIGAPYLLRGRPVHVAASIGIAAYPRDGDSFEDLLRHADSAMYQAKRQGGRYQQYDAGSDAGSPDLLSLEAELRAAIAGGTLALYAQPLVDLADNTPVGLEVLVRWPHPRHGLMTPAQFIPLAEECGLIQELDRWVFRRLLLQLGEFNPDGLRHIAVNFSPRTLHDPGLPAFIAACLAESGVDPAQLVVELTESTNLESTEALREVLERIAALGLRIALDDFGMGYATLESLKVVPADILKIDMSFVGGLGHNRFDEGVVRAILSLARSLELDVIAEGIDSGAQREWLLAAGCRLGQGYLLGRPVPLGSNEPQEPCTDDAAYADGNRQNAAPSAYAADH